MRILITGKHSYIGSSFKNFLKNKPEYIVDEISVRDDKWKYHSFKNYDVIIHLAALVHKNEKKFTLEDYEKVNVNLTIDIAKKAIKEKVGKFIFFSTMAVYGKQKVIKKSSKLAPTTKYGISKLKAEDSLMAIVKNSEMNLTIIRPPMIYGLGSKGNAKLIENLSYFTCFFPETFNRKSFISIQKLNMIILENFDNKTNKIIHPQDKNYHSTFELFKYYRSINNKKAYPMKIIGYFLKKINFLYIINKVFGDSYYDFND
jgi:UDP-glucose 4-epimerase